MKIFLLLATAASCLATPAFAIPSKTTDSSDSATNAAPAISIVTSTSGRVNAKALLRKIGYVQDEEMQSCLYDCEQEEYQAYYANCQGLDADRMYFCEEGLKGERGACEDRCYMPSQPPEPVPNEPPPKPPFPITT